MTFATFAQIRELLRFHRGLMAKFALTSLGRMALSMAGILLIREFLAGAIGEAGGLSSKLSGYFGEATTLWIVAVVFAATYVGSSMLNYANQIIQQRIVKIVELGTMVKLIRHLLRLSVPFFDRRSHGDIIQAVRSDVTDLRATTMALARIFLDGTLALGFLAAAVWLSPRLAFYSLLVVPFALVPVFWVARRTQARSFVVRRRGYVLLDIVLELLRGIRIIKAYQGEEREAQAAVEKGRRYFDELIKMVRVEAISGVVMESLAGFSIVVVIIVGGLQVVGGGLTWPSMLAFVMAIRALHGPLSTLNRNYMVIQKRAAAVHRIDELLAEEPEIKDGPNPRPLHTQPRKITLDNVGFSFGDRPALSGISFEVRAGEKIGIMGPSGAGKSTLLNLIARYYDPTEGSIRFDDHDLREYRVADVYSQLGIVTQEPLLFATSIRDNILCGRPDASEDDMLAAARAAEIDDEIRSLPEGYDTIVGIGGRRLSGGQSQRINIARALLKNPGVLLLDEPTSSLDSISDARVRSAISALIRNPTTFMISHRISTLADADRILVLEHGVSVGLGTHDELVRDCELYRRLLAAQQVGEASEQSEPPVVDPGEIEIDPDEEEDGALLGEAP
jgi:subfamily B ATP-binding cassette protein MsbA